MSEIVSNLDVFTVQPYFSEWVSEWGGGGSKAGISGWVGIRMFYFQYRYFSGLVNSGLVACFWMMKKTFLLIKQPSFRKSPNKPLVLYSLSSSWYVPRSSGPLGNHLTWFLSVQRDNLRNDSKNWFPTKHCHKKILSSTNYLTVQCGSEY